MNRKNILKALVLIIIAIVIVGIFLAKRESTASALQEPVVETTVVASAPVPVETVSHDEVVVDEVADVVEVEEVESPEPEIDPLFVSEIDEEALRSSGLPVMIQFFSTTCVPCMSMMDDLRAFYSENYGKVKVVALNVQDYPEAASSYPVVVVPTQLFFTASGAHYSPSQRIIGSVGGFAQFTYQETGELAYIVHQGVLSKTQMERIAQEAGRL